jgi:hypothetical protein
MLLTYRYAGSSVVLSAVCRSKKSEPLLRCLGLNLGSHRLKTILAISVSAVHPQSCTVVKHNVHHNLLKIMIPQLDLLSTQLCFVDFTRAEKHMQGKQSECLYRV